MTTAPVPIPGPLGLGDLLDRAFRLYRAHFWSLVTIAAMLIVPVALVTGLLTGSAFGIVVDLQEMAFNEQGDVDFVARMFVYLAIIFLAGLLEALAYGFASLALTAHNLASLQQRPITIWDGLRTAARHYWTFLGMSILRWLAQLAVAVAVIVPIACIFVGWFASVAAAEGTSEIALFGVVVLTIAMYGVAIAVYLVPMIYLGARWIVPVPGIIDQSWRAVQSLRNSWRLTRGNTWRCIGYLVLLGLLNLVVTSLPSLLITQAVTILLPFDVMLATTLSSAVSSVFSILWQPLSAAAVVLLYYDLRVREESYDLSLRIAQMEAVPALPAAASDAFTLPAPPTG